MSARLARILGTAGFCPGTYAALLGWSADGTVLYLTHPLAPTFVVRAMDALTGELVSARELDAGMVIAAVPAGVAHALAAPSDGGYDRCALWDLDEGTRVGEIRYGRARTSTLALPLDDDQYPMQACVADVLSWAAIGPSDRTDPDAVSVDRAMLLRIVDSGSSSCLGAFDADDGLLWTLERTPGDSACLATFTLDGGVFVAFARGGLGCWGLSEGAWRWREPRHDRGVVALVRSPDGRTFYSFGEDGRLRATGADGASRWETALRRRSVRWPGEATIVPSPDGRLVAVALRGSVRVVDAATGADLTALDGHADAVRGLAFSRDGRLLASGAGGDVRVHDARTGETHWVLETDAEEVADVAFRADRPSVLVHDLDGFAGEWSLDTGLERSRVREQDGGVVRLAAATDGDRVLVTDGLRRRLWVDRSPERAEWSYEMTREDANARRLAATSCRDAFSGDGARAILTAMILLGSDGDRTLLTTLDVATGLATGDHRELPGETFVVVQGDERTLLVTATGEALVVFDERGEETPWRVPGSSRPQHGALSRDGRVLAFAVDVGVEVWRLGEPSRRLDALALAPDEEVTALALSPDGAALAVGTNYGRVWLFAVDVDGRA